MPSTRNRSRLALTLGGLSLCASLGVGVLLASASTRGDAPAKTEAAAIPTIPVVPGPTPPVPAPPPAMIATVVPPIVVDVGSTVVPAGKPVARKIAKKKKAKTIDFGELDGY
jgi:hypothetical protein